MTTVFIRTLIIYILLISIIKLMGKRQVGELEISELVSTLLLSELATVAITNSNILCSIRQFRLLSFFLLKSSSHILQ